MTNEQMTAITQIILSWSEWKRGVLPPYEARDMIRRAWPELNTEEVKYLGSYFGRDNPGDENK